MLDSVQLPDGGRTTTRLGFGCSGLMGGISEKESLLLLETSYEAGIRHFDVAPSYGYGHAERCVGKFLRGKPDATVTTKHGIQAPARAGMLEAIRVAVRPVARRFPAIRARLAAGAANLKTKAKFSAEEGLASLEHSLGELRVEKVDLWLLHEPSPEDLTSSDLLPLLTELQQAGKIGSYGVGAERSRVEKIWITGREYCHVLQYEWSILDLSPMAFAAAFRIQHRVVSGALPALRTAMERDPDICRRWSDVVDADLSQADTCAALLMNLALLRNTGGIVLFSSRNPAHIRAIADAAGTERWRLRASRFHDLLQGL